MEAIQSRFRADVHGTCEGKAEHWFHAHMQFAELLASDRPLVIQATLFVLPRPSGRRLVMAPTAFRELPGVTWSARAKSLLPSRVRSGRPSHYHM